MPSTIAERTDPGLRVVLVAAPDLKTAERLGGVLVKERLAACANLVPGVVSLYRWDGTMQRDDEVLLVLKSTEGRTEELQERIVALHPYEVPEVLTLLVVGGHEPYLRWAEREVEG